MKIWLTITTLLMLAFALGANAATTTARVTFKPEAQVQPGSDVLVKDIAGIQAPAGLAARIGQVVVARAPMPGQSRTLDAGYIKGKIAFAEPKAAISALGAQQVKITGACVRMTGAQLADAVKEFAAKRIPNDGREYEVTVDPISREVVAPAGEDISVEPELLSEGLHAGLNPVRINVRSGSHSVAVTFASVRVTVTARVLVATDQIDKSASLTTANTTWDKRDISKVPNAIIEKDDSSYRDFVARRPIRPGAVVTSDDVALPAAIKQGDTISLVVRCGKVVLQTAAEARQTGSVGDTIRVMSPASTGEVRAKIIEPGLAEIKI